MKQIYKSLNTQRRFYSGVSVAPSVTEFAILLDGRAPRSPRGRPLALPTRGAADLVAAEWSAQAASIDMASMPMTRLTHTALDGVAETRAETAASVARFAGADLVCYFAEGPTTLVARQEATWAPLIDWAREDLGLAFERSRGIAFRNQPPATLAAVEALAAGVADFALAGLALAAATFGSAILSLALWRGRVTGAEAFSASRLDEAFQAETWGEDAEATVAAGQIAADADMLDRWFRALA